MGDQSVLRKGYVSRVCISSLASCSSSKHNFFLSIEKRQNPLPNSWSKSHFQNSIFQSRVEVRLCLSTPLVVTVIMINLSLKTHGKREI